MAKGKKKTPVVSRKPPSSAGHAAAAASSSADAAPGRMPSLPRKNKARRAITRFHAETKLRLAAAATADAAGGPVLDTLQVDSAALAQYQQASMKIQSTKYPSELLVALLGEIFPSAADAVARKAAAKLLGGDPAAFLVDAATLRTSSSRSDSDPDAPPGLRLLDVGALEGPVAYQRSARAGTFASVVSIDLHPQSPAVQAGDFFHYPDPSGCDWTAYAAQPVAPAAWKALDPMPVFDVVSLSLVVNFLPTANARGAMLAKAAAHLDPDGARLVWLVLPRACVDNARYMTRDHLVSAVMGRGVGAVVVAERWSAKLWCGLFQVSRAWAGPAAAARRGGKVAGSGDVVKKSLVNDGKGRNNFSIVV
ncbi:25S rRNA (adenine2142-N1)-methyltransferase [Blastocladiella emersonii ATCC 22665]|nr:25S rRNA (adenine2142-N1)-methyltransferase [Blastocladiella emersonii ATCC 22665]